MCRKGICLFLVISLALSIAPAFALNENIDLSSMSIEELRDLKTKIDKEILDREGCSMWFDYGIGQYIPKIILQSGEEPVLGKLQINDNDTFYVSVENHGEQDYDAYVEMLVTFGFFNNVDRSRIQFSAMNDEGYTVEVTHWGTSAISIKGYPPAKKK